MTEWNILKKTLLKYWQFYETYYKNEIVTPLVTQILNYNNRGHFLKNVLNPILEEGVEYRDGKSKSPYAQIKIKVNSVLPSRKSNKMNR